MKHAGCELYLKSVRYIEPAARMLIKAGFGGFALVKKCALMHYTTDVGLLDDSASPEKIFCRWDEQALTPFEELGIPERGCEEV